MGGAAVNTNVELLNFIYKNAEMGKQTLPQLLEVCEDASFREVILSQLREYQEICEAAASMAREEHQEAKGIGAMAKISSYLSVNMNTMIDKTSSHLAEMMMQGMTRYRHIRKVVIMKPTLGSASA